MSPTTAHHPIHDRYGTTKSSDLEAIPLCDGHHQTLGTKLKLLQYTIIKRNGESYTDLIGPIQSKTHKRKAPGHDPDGNKLFLHRC